jgi:hypothetical protein
LKGRWRTRWRTATVDGIGRLDFEGDSLASQGLHEDLHASTQTVYDGKDGGQGGGSEASMMKTEESRLDFEGGSLAGQDLHEDLHASIQAYDEGQGGVNDCRWYRKTRLRG